MFRFVAIILSLGLACFTLVSCARTPQQKEAAFLQTGGKHLQSGDFERAILDFRNAAQAMPKDAEPRYQLGLAYLRAGDAQAAIHELNSAVKLNPAHSGANLKLAELMTGNSNPDVVKLGREKAQEVLALTPNDADALRTLAVAELRLDDSGDAEQHLEEALKAVPQHLNSSMTLALLKLRQKDVAGAEQVLLKSAAAAPRSPEHVMVLARFYQLVHKPEEVEKQYRHALELDPKYGPALAGLGVFLYSNGKLEEADQIFQRASALPDKQYHPLHALFLLQIGKNDAGIRELDEQYKADPQDRGARTRLIAAYSKLGRNADAEKVLADALKKNSKDSDALMQRGAFNLAAGKFPEAQSDVTEVLRTRPDYAQAHLLLSRIHRARGASQSQIHELIETLRLSPKLLVARLELAHAFTLSNSPKSAMEVLDQAPAQDRQNVGLIIERNIALEGLGDYAQLRKGIDQGLALSQDPRLLWQDGLLKLKQKDTKGGRASLEEMLKQQPQQWSAVETLASTYLMEKRGAEATSIVREYTSRAPNSASGQQFLGSWLLRTGDLTGAEAAFQASKRIDSNASGADFGLAQVALKEGKVDSARDLLTGIVSRDDHNVPALFSLGEMEEQAGRADAAISDYDKVLQADSNHVGALNNLAYLLADTQADPDKALALAQRVKELVPENPAIDDTIGWAYYNKGLFKTAVEYLGKAEKGGTPRRKSHLAMAYIRLGNRQEAATILQAALKAEPSSPDAHRALQLLAQGR